MRLRRQSVDDVQVIALSGAVTDDDAALLGETLGTAFDAAPRGVVVDLGAVERVGPRALDAFVTAATRAGRWPRTSLAVCCAAPDLRALLEPSVTVHAGRPEAMQHVDDRPAPPRRDVTVEHGPSGPAQARCEVERWATEIGLDGLSDDLLLIVSELVTNAVRYGRPPVRLEVSADARSVTVAVVDGAVDRPAPRSPSECAESGRGLLLIDLLSVEHGVRPEPPGKVVWASLPR